MKKVLFLAVLLSGSSVFAQHQNALTHFMKTFPEAEDVFWDEYDEYHEASFINDDKDMLCRYDQNGKWLETATSISEEDLPSGVKKSLMNATSIDNVSSITLIDKVNGTSTYEINVDTENESFTLIYNKEGSLIKRIDSQDEF